jgi:hypothetical protein
VTSEALLIASLSAGTSCEVVSKWLRQAQEGDTLETVLECAARPGFACFGSVILACFLLQAEYQGALDRLQLLAEEVICKCCCDTQCHVFPAKGFAIDEASSVSGMLHQLSRGLRSKKITYLM